METPNIIQRSQTGDLDAFGELVILHEGWLRGFLRSRIRDWASADDLAQDVFVTAFRQIKLFRGEAPFEAWLRGIAVNHLRNFFRKRRDQPVGGSQELQAMIDAGDSFFENGEPRLEALQECLQKVDGSSRGLLEERYLKGKSVRELALETGRGYSALTMQLHRLREVLAECVKSKLEGARA